MKPTTRTLRPIRGNAFLWFLACGFAAVCSVPAAWGADDAKPADAADKQPRIRLACLGDSITEGIGPGKHACWVTLVRNALGKTWEVKNYGSGGATLLKKGNKPYHTLNEFKLVLTNKPDVVTIALGTNDSKPPNWKFKQEFAADYADMIAEIRKVNPNVRIYCCLPPPAFPGNWGISDATIKDEIIPLIRQVAKDANCAVIDLYTPLIGKAEFAPDRVHPKAKGHLVMAATIYRSLTGQDAPEGALKADPKPLPH